MTASLDPVSVALQLAAEHPEAALGCPACDASVKGANLARHVEKVHPVPADTGSGPWRGTTGLLRGRLVVESEVLELNRPLGLDRRVVLPAALTVGAARSSRVDVIETNIGLPNPRAVEEPAGVYLRVGSGRRSIVIRCRTGGGLRRHWTGWEQGKRVHRWHITLEAADFAALQYVLAARGLLHLRG